MQELKGLNTTDFYSRFFVETALDKHVSASRDEVQSIQSLGERFLTCYHNISSTTPYSILREHSSWYHQKLLSSLGYKNLESFFYRTNKSRGLPVRGKVTLVDDEELWIIEGPFGTTKKEVQPLEDIPNCSQLEIVDENKNEYEIDKSQSYHKIIRSILADDNPCAWVIFAAGERLYLFEREKTLSNGSYIEVDWPEVFSNKDNKLIKAIVGLFSAKAFAVKNGDIAHNQLAETAHREAHGVTKNLKYGVRDALELLVNEVLFYHRNVTPVEALTELEDEENNDEIARILADEGLRYLYRLLFLFFVESRGRESEILPVKSLGYSLGYSLENIRNLELKRISGAKNGNYIQETLSKTFEIMFHGVSINHENDLKEDYYSSGFECPKVGTLLFDPAKTPVLNEVHLRDLVMKDVVSKLSISEMGKGRLKKCARISYANLGLNQLGAVYEGLLSLKPIIIEDEECYTVNPGNKDEVFLVSKSELKNYKKDQVLKDQYGKPLLHSKGDFLFRTIGYERKYSASFYTDETLTKCLVKECLKEHFKKDNDRPSSKQVEEMKVLEPAMGSGAFLNETANQLAVYYVNALDRESKLDDDTPRSDAIASAKEFIMRNCLYGVDLNPMATELAKVSLWLNCVHKNSTFSFHDFKVRRGNSLIGASLGLKSSFCDHVPHFLVPIPSMIDCYLDVRVLNNKKNTVFSEGETTRLVEIRESYENSSNEVNRLRTMSKAVGSLYSEHNKKRLRFREKILQANLNTYESERLYLQFLEENVEYKTLRLIMDYWCSLWFWRHDAIDSLPDLAGYLDDIEMIIETKGRRFKRKTVINETIKVIPFFHFDLEFPEVFERGGFDLVIGNPPWARIDWSDSEWQEDNKIKSKEDFQRKEKEYIEQKLLNLGQRAFLKKSKIYDEDKSDVNTYKYFWQLAKKVSRKTFGLIMQNGFSKDIKLESLRNKYYDTLSKLYRFTNHQKLFDCHPEAEFCISISNIENQGEVKFNLMDYILHPLQIQKATNGAVSRDETCPPLILGKNNTLIVSHPLRMLEITLDDIKLLNVSEEDENSIEGENNGLTILPYLYTTQELNVLKKLRRLKNKLSEYEPQFLGVQEEKKAVSKKLIKVDNRAKKIDEVVIMGPSVNLNNVFSAEKNKTAKNRNDYRKINLEEIAGKFVPFSNYRATAALPFTTPKNETLKIIHRNQVNIFSKRTLLSAVAPSNLRHLDSLKSFCLEDIDLSLYLQGILSTVIYDLYGKCFCGGKFTKVFFLNLPVNFNNDISKHIIPRVLRLNCITQDFKEIWEKGWKKEYSKTPYLKEFFHLSTGYLKCSSSYKENVVIRKEIERSQVQVELDILTSFSIGLSKDELKQIYSTQFFKTLDIIDEESDQKYNVLEIIDSAYDFFLNHFGITEMQVVEGYFNKANNLRKEVA